MGCSQPAADIGQETNSISGDRAGPAAAALETYGTPARVRLMTSAQYTNTLSHILGSEILIASPFAPLPRREGLLASSAAFAGVPSGELQQFQRAAISVAAQVVDEGNLDLRLSAHRDLLIPCKPVSLTAADDKCATKFITEIGRLLYRRPLSETRRDEFVVQANESASRLEDFYAGISSVLEGMLVSPNVLLISDEIEADPDSPGRRRLNAYSLASRLSFFLWNAAPDDMLLRAAESGEIHSQKGRARIVEESAFRSGCTSLLR